MRCLAGFLAAICICSPARAQETSKRVLLMKPHTSDADLAERVVKAYAGVISEVPGFAAVTAYDVEDLLARAAAGHPEVYDDGCEQASCWKIAARAVTTQYVVGGFIAAVEGDLVVGLTLVDAQTQRIVATAAESATDADDAVMAGPVILARLFGWDTTEEGGFTLVAGQNLALATLELRARDLDQETAARLTRMLVGALRDADGVTVIASDRVRSKLDPAAQQRALECVDAACLAEIGSALEVEKVVAGYITRLSGRHVVGVRLIDTRSADVSARVTESFTGDPGQLFAAVRFAGHRLLGTRQEDPGNIVVSSSESDASVFVNDQVRGELPMPALAGLAPGVYRIRVAKRGFDDWLSDVYVEPDATSAVWAPLQPQPPVWYQTWWFWTGVGAVVVGTAAILIANAASLPDTDLGNVEVR